MAHDDVLDAFSEALADLVINQLPVPDLDVEARPSAGFFVRAEPCDILPQARTRRKTKERRSPSL